MKRTALILLVAAIASDVFAQTTYCNINVGYALPMNAQSLDHLGFSNTSVNNSAITYTEEKVSLGSGLNVGVSFGHMFTPYLGTELNVGYLFGSQSKAADNFDDYAHTDYTISSNMIRFTPSIIFTAGLSKINPYAKVGVVIGAGSLLYRSVGYDDGGSFANELKCYGGVAIGMNASVGVTYSLGDKLSLFGELNMISQSYAPTKGELTEVSEDGVDQLPNYTTRDREVEFVDNYRYDYQNPGPDTEPRKEAKVYFPYGSIGLNVGLRISF
ncbi:MAG TPA: outer membrane beta-barrel protein [Chryseolinea sp.]|nr:outer membrane beta-barrel protein [Chryseolinea sp.]